MSLLRLQDLIMQDLILLVAAAVHNVPVAVAAVLSRVNPHPT